MDIDFVPLNATMMNASLATNVTTMTLVLSALNVVNNSSPMNFTEEVLPSVNVTLFNEFAVDSMNQSFAEPLTNFTTDMQQDIVLNETIEAGEAFTSTCLLYTSPSPRD